MGRHAGWMTAACTLAAEREGDAPQVLLLPEVAFNEGRFSWPRSRRLWSGTATALPPRRKGSGDLGGAGGVVRGRVERATTQSVRGHLDAKRPRACMSICHDSESPAMRQPQRARSCKTPASSASSSFGGGSKHEREAIEDANLRNLTRGHDGFSEISAKHARLLARHHHRD
jgi:hypothetical protein